MSEAVSRVIFRLERNLDFIPTVHHRIHESDDFMSKFFGICADITQTEILRAKLNDVAKNPRRSNKGDFFGLNPTSLALNRWLYLNKISAFHSTPVK